MQKDDVIYRQDAIDAIFEAFSTGDEGADRYIAEKNLADLPSAQPEIIRCGECKYYTPVMAHCEIRGKGLYLIRGMEDFCSRAERKDE